METAGFSRVLVPLDGSAEAEAIIPFALRLAGRPELLLLRVVEAGVPLVAEGSRRVTREDIERPRVEAEAYLTNLARQLEAQGARATTAVRVGSDPATEIRQAASELGVDVIAMATHGRRGLTRLFTRSVAEAVLRRAPVPMFLTSAEAQAMGRAA